eukprot:CAMPEP_0113279574 /NCGR_PEP_ID=MMETSP0008_2-20120614/27256_1 /TAXON_ID=97485 /ORGANISM="Prymnesium parvum" /LENGTH=89 /DNA_ID=CAMNT_0000129765 /DNA_START=285 /DNA_END=551 /DNA_ORIENTATION=+ /assembly_acc=CAM_ASM_000153
MSPTRRRRERSAASRRGCCLQSSLASLGGRRWASPRRPAAGTLLERAPPRAKAEATARGEKLFAILHAEGVERGLALARQAVEMLWGEV